MSNKKNTFSSDIQRGAPINFAKIAKQYAAGFSKREKAQIAKELEEEAAAENDEVFGRTFNLGDISWATSTAMPNNNIIWYALRDGRLEQMPNDPTAVSEVTEEAHDVDFD